MTRLPKKAPPRPAPVPRAPAKRQRQRAVVAEVVEPVTALAIPQRSEDAPALYQIPRPTTPAQRELLATWLVGKSADTRRAYIEGATHFAKWLVAHGHASAAGLPGDIVADALQVDFVDGNLLATLWVRSQQEAGLKPSTIRTRCSAVRVLCDALAAAGRIGYVPKFKAPKRKARAPQDAERQYAGVPAAFLKVARGLEQLAVKRNAAIEDVRDFAIVRMAADMGLRRIEIVSTDVEHIDLGARKAMVFGKGRDERELLTIPPPLVPILARWLRARAAVIGPTGPLFVSLGGGRGNRISGRIRHRSTLNAMLHRRADQFGVALRPHDLRRVFCTETLERYGADVAKSLTRHASVDTLGLYDLRQGKGVAAMADSVGGAIDKMVHAKPPRGKKVRKR